MKRSWNYYVMKGVYMNIDLNAVYERWRMDLVHARFFEFCLELWETTLKCPVHKLGQNHFRCFWMDRANTITTVCSWPFGNSFQGYKSQSQDVQEPGHERKTSAKSNNLFWWARLRQSRHVYLMSKVCKMEQTPSFWSLIFSRLCFPSTCTCNIHSNLMPA